jgi:hypothetical protein
MRSSCSLFVSVFLNCFVPRQRFDKVYPSFVPRQRVCEKFTAGTNGHGILGWLDVSFSIWPLSYIRDVRDKFFQSYVLMHKEGSFESSELQED